MTAHPSSSEVTGICPAGRVATKGKALPSAALPPEYFVD
jgi:hypothetical protein